MQHRGEILQKAVRKSGIPLSKVARLVGKSRTWLYNQFESQDVGLDVLLEIGKVIHYDFTTDIDELNRISQLAGAGLADEDAEQYPAETAEYWKNKYLQLLEEFNLFIRMRATETYKSSRKTDHKTRR
jgi:hypothetical protein